MLETEIKKLTAAVTALTEVLTANPTAAAPAAPAEPAPAAPAPAAPAPAAPAAPAADPAAAWPDPAAPAAPAAPPAATADAPAGDPAVTVNPKMLADDIIALAKAKGRDQAMALLAKYGVQKTSDLPEAQFGQFHAEAQQLIAS